MLTLHFSAFGNISDSYAVFIYTDQMLPYDEAVLQCITTNRSRLLTEEVISVLHGESLRKSSWFYSQTYQLSGSCSGELSFLLLFWIIYSFSLIKDYNKTCYPVKRCNYRERFCSYKYVSFLLHNSCAEWEGWARK